MLVREQKITLISLILLFAAFTFGQNVPEKKPDKFKELGLEKNMKASYSKVRKNNRELEIQKNLQSSESNLLKSAQITKQILDSLIINDWDKSSSQWVESLKAEYTYDANGNMIQEIEYEWDEITSQWIESWKEANTYNANGDMTQYLGYYWDQSTSQWVESWKEEDTYDANGKMTQELDYEWDDSTSQWIESWKAEYTYNGIGNMTQELDYERDDSTSQWVESWKVEYTYDANGNMTLELDYEWDDSTSQWIESWKDEFIYNSNGFMSQNLGYYWDESTSQWVENWKAGYTYDANGNPENEIYYELDQTTYQFSTYSKYDYTYDLSYSLSALILPPLDWFVPDYSEQIVNKPLEYSNKVWDKTSNVWVDEFKGIYYYSEQNGTNVENIEENISLYPNPVSEYLNISFISNNTATIELFDIQGHKVISKRITNNDQLILKDLKNGMYIYNLYINGNKHSGKLIKE